MKNKLKYIVLCLLVIAATVGLAACSSVPAPTGTPPQLQQELDEVPSPGTWHIFKKGDLQIGPLKVVNKVPSMQINPNLLTYVVEKFGTPTTKLPLTLIFVPGKYVQKTQSGDGYVEAESGLGGLTITGKGTVTVVIPVGWTTQVGTYEPTIPGCGVSLPGLDRAAYVTMATGHELFGHGFFRANQVEKSTQEECSALWFEGHLLEEIGKQRFVRFP